ncbi:copper resistance D family protein [Paraliobacillus sediminis]|uniref:copper resistance D family protein n=1 Tax=Paraliobacillus sediminis TaxID=1885916 RepID=UPI000E3CA5E1|nr:CopD family protein [Paraliobacillus sediminis]
MIYAITNGLLYVCFSILIGTHLLSLLPEEMRMYIKVKKRILIGVTSAIPILAVIPIIDLVNTISKYRVDNGFTSFIYVIKEIEIGRAWFILLLLSIFHLFILAIRKHIVIYPVIGLFLMLGIVLTQSVVGHAASMASYPGALSHTIHLLAVCFWAGTLFVVSWFANDDTHWKSFVNWFSIMALICLVFVTFTGLFMSFSLTEGTLVSSWRIPYGQALLIKHLLYVALLLFVFINAVLINKKIKKSTNFSPKRWWRAESAIILLIFSVTGFMSEQEPPLDIEKMVNSGDSSILFRTFASVNIGDTVLFSPDFISIFFIFLSVVFLFSTLFVFWIQEKVISTLLMSGLAIFSLYVGLMSSVTVF